MKKNIRNITWGYGYRVLLESAFVVLALSVLLVIQLELLPVYINRAKLIEPINLSEDIQRYMMIDRAFTGEFSTRNDVHIDLSGWQNSVKDFSVDYSGNVLIADLYKEENETLSGAVSIGMTDEGFSILISTSGSKNKTCFNKL